MSTFQEGIADLSQHEEESNQNLDSTEAKERMADLFHEHKNHLANFVKVKLKSTRVLEDPTILAEDILQDSLVKLMGYVERNPEVHLYDPYLFFRTVVYNAMLDYIQRSKSLHTIPAGSVDMFENVLTRNPSIQEEVLTPEDILERQEVADFIVGMGEKTKSKNFERNLIILRMELEGYTGEEVAEALQKKGYFEEYNLSDEHDRKKAVDLVHQSFKRTFSLVTNELREKLG